MAYDHYRNAYPGWGTSEFRIGTPPPPAFWPQPAWRGWDYYQAYGINPDHGLFSSILRNVRPSSRDADGFSSSDVRSLHRRVYSGLVNLSVVLPNDLGSAAAYEAYRTWKSHTRLYQPLGGDPNREREGLVGLAVAEASRLWSCAGRPMDNFAFRNASEAAAVTASMLFYRKLGREVGASSGRRNSDVYERDFAYGEGHPLHRPTKRSSVVPSVIRTGGMPGITPPGTAHSAPIPMPRARTASFGGGMPGSIGSSPSMYASQPYSGGSPYRGGTNINTSPYMGNGVPGGYAGSQMMVGQPGMYAGAPAQYPYSAQMGQPGVPYAQPGVPGQVMFPQQGMYPQQGSMIMQGGVPLQGSPSMYGGGGVLPGQAGMYGGGIVPTTGNMAGYSTNGSVDGYPPGTIIIRQPSHHRRSSSSSRHRHRKHSHHRSRSMEPPLLLEGAYDSGGSWYR